MPEWLMGILFVGALFGGVFVWEALKGKAVEKGGKLGQAAEAIEAAEEVTGSVLHTLMQKGLGVVVLAFAVLCFYLLSRESDLILLAGGVVCAGYAIYLLLPGQRSFWF